VKDETGEPPIPSPAHGSPTESGRPAASGYGRRCQGAGPGGEGPDLVHRQQRGSPWWAHGGEAGAHRGGLAVVGNRRRHAGEEVEGTGSGFVERR
jgi:hypothetical protein